MLLFLLALAGNYMGCETEDWSFEVDCNDCYGVVPDSANLIIHLTINQENPEVPITVYLGSLEAGIIDWRDTTDQAEYYLYAAMNASYTVEATYHSGDRTILTYDGDRMSINDMGDACGSPCYVVKGGIFDNRLLE